MLRRFSRLQRSQVQTWRPFSTPSAHVSRAADSSSGIRPHLRQTGGVASWLIRPVLPSAASIVTGLQICSVVGQQVDEPWAFVAVRNAEAVECRPPRAGDGGVRSLETVVGGEQERRLVGDPKTIEVVQERHQARVRVTQRVTCNFAPRSAGVMARICLLYTSDAADE